MVIYNPKKIGVIKNMKLADLLDKKHIICNPKVSDKIELYNLMLKSCADELGNISQYSLLNAIAEREQLAPVVFENFALPHARIENLDNLIIALALFKDGFNFDGQKINFVIMILTSQEKSKIYLQTLRAISILFQNKQNVENLLKCEDCDEVLHYISALKIEVSDYVLAKDIMTAECATAKENMTIRECLNLMFKHELSGLPVIDDNNKLKGEISLTDILNIGIPDYLKKIPNLAFLKKFEPFEELLKKENSMKVKEVMRQFAFIATPETSVIELAMAIVEKSMRRIPVCDKNKKLLGIVTRTDLLKKVIVG